LILVDTSVWIDFLAGRPAAAEVRERLLANELTCHPAVRGEVALGNLADRGRVLALLASLPRAPLVDDEAVLRFIGHEKLHGTGVGWVDAHLLASAAQDESSLWTHDKRLAKVARRLGLLRRADR
jgi:predicted nucleic acid-binding protein